MSTKTILIDGIEYTPKTEQKAEQVDGLEYVLVRTEKAGVFVGYLASAENSTLTLKNARRLWYWDGAASLSQLAVDGVSKPESCKFPCEVDEITLLGVIEIIPVTQKAKESIAGVPIWSA